MDPTTQAVICYVSDGLYSIHSIQQDGIPYGVWVRHYNPVPADFSGDGDLDLSTPLIRAWFVGPEGTAKEDTWAYRRFEIMQLRQTWSIYGEPRRLEGNRHCYRIALAAFARYEDSDEFYLETIWGGTWARGMRVQMIEGQVTPTHNLWLS